MRRRPCRGRPGRRIALGGSGELRHRRVSRSAATACTIAFTSGATASDPGYIPATSPKPPRSETSTGRRAASHSTIVNVGPPGSAQTEGMSPTSQSSRKRRFASPVKCPSQRNPSCDLAGRGDLFPEPPVAGQPQAEPERRQTGQGCQEQVDPLDAVEGADIPEH